MEDKKIVESVKELITSFVASGDTKDLISGIGSLIKTEIDRDEVIMAIKQRIDDVDIQDLIDTEFNGNREDDDDEDDSGRRRGDEYED